MPGIATARTGLACAGALGLWVLKVWGVLRSCNREEVVLQLVERGAGGKTHQRTPLGKNFLKEMALEVMHVYGTSAR